MDDVLGREEFAVTEVGIVFRKPCDFEIWQMLGEKLLFYQKSIQWLVGDWLIYGEQNMGEKYSQCLDSMKIDYTTMMNYRRIAMAFPIGSRWPSLSWTHHREVAELPPEQQQFWLKAAHDNNWSVRDLIHHMAGGSSEPGDYNSSGSDQYMRVWKAFLRLTTDDQERFVKQAQRHLGNTDESENYGEHARRPD